MADEASFPSSTPSDSSTACFELSASKRKFEDPHADKEISRTSFSDKSEAGTGASGGANLHHKPGIYSSVPPPLSDFELAKQKAAEIAARLVSSAHAGTIGGPEAVKRVRTDNNGSEDRGISNDSIHDHGFGEAERVSKFDDVPIDNQSSQKTLTDIQHMPYHNHEASFFDSLKMDVPNAKVGMVIGKGGETIKNLQYQSGAKIQITRDADADPTAPTRQVEIMGTSEQISRAEQLIKDVIAEAAIGASSFPTRGSGVAVTGEQASIRVPNSKVGLIIGRGGETIRSLQGRSGARIQFALPQDGEQGTLERIVTLTGTKQQTDMASELIKELIDENRVRGPPMYGGYSQPYFRPPAPGPHWASTGPPSYPAYGYQQQGPYPGPPHQYPPPPPQQYGGYAQPPSGWNQMPPGQPQQSSDQGSYSQPQQQQATYDSYSQQSQQSQMQQSPQPGVDATDGSYTYNQQGYYGSYPQQPSATYQQQEYEQGFNQPQQAYNQTPDGFGHPPEGYGSQQEGYNQLQGYDQQAYSGGYEYNQTTQQSYGDHSQYANTSEGPVHQPAAGDYNYNQFPQTAASQGVLPSTAQS